MTTSALPSVSIIVPCFNEAATIIQLLSAIEAQEFSHAQMEIIIADGMSTDGTRERVAEYARHHPELDLRVVDNPDQTIPAALNRAVEAARGDTVVRLDAHSEPRPDYLRRVLQVLESTGAANVGGLWEIEPSADTWPARSIAAAAAHPLGAGDARYRISGEAGEVDTVPFGAFTKRWLKRVGPFDENLLTNEDYEFNVRLRNAGGLVWFDPTIRTTYYARRSWGDLIRQYARYGYWKAHMLTRHPESLRWRQALPPLLVLGVFAFALWGLAEARALTLLALGGAAYGIVLLVAGVIEAVRRRQPGLSLGVPISLALMHFAWGSAFWVGMVRSLLRGSRRGN